MSPVCDAGLRDKLREMKLVPVLLAAIVAGACQAARMSIEDLPGEEKIAVSQQSETLAPTLDPIDNTTSIFKEKLSITAEPDQTTIDAAAQNGELEQLNGIYQQWKRTPSQSGLNEAAGSGRLDVLKWMSELNPPVLPDRNSALWAARSGHLDILKWMSKLNPPAIPDKYGAFWAARNGRLDILEWMSELNPPVIPDKDAAFWAAQNGHSNVVDWMASLTPPIYPMQLDLEAKDGEIESPERMASLDPQALPDQGEAEEMLSSQETEAPSDRMDSY